MVLKSSLLLFFTIGISVSVAMGSNSLCIKSEVDSLRATGLELHQKLKEAKEFFIHACQNHDPKAIERNLEESEALMAKAPSNLLSGHIPLSDPRGTSTKDFLDLVLKRVREKHRDTQDLNEKLRACTSSTRGTQSECQGIDHWIKNELPMVTHLGRASLALSLPTDSADKISQEQLKTLNSSLSDLGSYRATNWEPLTDSEQKEAQGLLDRLANGLRKENTNYQPLLVSSRHSYYMVYLSLMGSNPILHFLKSPQPDAREVQKATQEVQKALNKESKSLDEIEKSLKTPLVLGRGVRTLPNGVLDLLNYKLEVEEVLLQNPQFCGLALNLFEIETSRKIVGGALQAVGWIGLSLATRNPRYLFAIGAAGSGQVMLESYQTYEREADRLSARLENDGAQDIYAHISDDGVIEPSEIDQVQRDINDTVLRHHRSQLRSVQERLVESQVQMASSPVYAIAPFALARLRPLLISVRSKLSKK